MTLPPYNMTADNENDETRNDDEIWRLVGVQPVIMAYRQMLLSVDAWVRTQEESDMFVKLSANLSTIERDTYDRFYKPGYRPSIEYDMFHRPAPELVPA
jgi:hypothetical protein